MFTVISLLFILISICKTAIINDLPITLPSTQWAYLFQSEMVTSSTKTLIQTQNPPQACYLTACQCQFTPHMVQLIPSVFPAKLEIKMSGTFSSTTDHCGHNNLIQNPTNPSSDILKMDAVPASPGHSLTASSTIAMKNGVTTMTPMECDLPDMSKYQFDIKQAKNGTTKELLSDEEAAGLVQSCGNLYAIYLQRQINFALEQSLNTDCAFSLFWCYCFNVHC